MNLLSEQQFNCPHCGELVDILLDASEPHQSYIEDCQVCCCPINISVNIAQGHKILVNVSHENE